MSPRFKFRGAVVSVAAAAMLTTAACGVKAENAKVDTGTKGNKTEQSEGNSGGPVTVPESFEGTGGIVYLNKAAETTAAVKTQKMTIKIDSKIAGQSVSFTMDGEIDLENNRSMISMDLGEMLGSMGGGDTAGVDPDMLKMTTITDGDTTYIKSAMFSMFSGDSKPWVSVPTNEMTSGANSELGNSQTDPNAFLNFLEKTGSEVTEVGKEKIRGVETTHLKTVLDIKDLMSQVDADQQAEMQEQLDALGSDAISEIPMEVWIDGDNMVRKMSMDMTVTAEGETVNMVMEIELYDFNKPVSITIPDPSQVSPMDMSELGGGFGN